MKRAASLLALLASACAASNAAPISYGGGAGPPAAPSARASPQRQQQQAAPRPQPNDPAPDWAAGPGTPLSDYALQPGAAQPFDPARLPRTHRVGANQSLYDIADRYQIPLRALIDQNRLEPPYTLAPGRVIELPPPRVHRIARGESFEDIARQYNVDLRSLALLNRMRSPYVVREGDFVVLPAMARPRTQTASALPAQPSQARMARAATPTAPLTAPAITPSTPAISEPAGRAPTLAWPLRGDVVGRFGVQPGGARIDGIEIAADEGASIAAAADGEVVYAGSDLGSYGTLVLVRHSDGYVTAYGYARRALVREGQHVRAGQALGEVGRIDARPPRLLFQVRRGREAIDPLPLLGAS